MSADAGGRPWSIARLLLATHLPFLALTWLLVRDIPIRPKSI